MAYRNILWTLPASALRKFDEGQVVEDCIPVLWGLAVGDHLEYEAGSNISGIAKVVSVGTEVSQMIDPSIDWNDFDDDDDLPMVDAVLCTFRKIS